MKIFDAERSVCVLLVSDSERVKRQRGRYSDELGGSNELGGRNEPGGRHGDGATEMSCEGQKDGDSDELRRPKDGDSSELRGSNEL